MKTALGNELVYALDRDALMGVVAYAETCVEKMTVAAQTRHRDGEPLGTSLAYMDDRSDFITLAYVLRRMLNEQK